MFVWGYGILGKGPELSESSTPERIPPALFGRSEFSPSVAVTRIRCGLNHFAAVTGESVCFATFWKLVLEPRERLLLTSMVALQIAASSSSGGRT